MKKIQISESELEVMKLLWKNGEMTSSQIVEKLLGKSEWKAKTIQTMISRLVTKGSIRAEKINEKNYLYQATVDENQYKEYANTSLLNKLYNGSVSMLISSLLRDEKLSNEEIKEMQKMLSERK